ncbi:hypothetical protein CLOM_g17803, partial [Closterium sp. NIES-68]
LASGRCRRRFRSNKSRSTRSGFGIQEELARSGNADQRSSWPLATWRVAASSQIVSHPDVRCSLRNAGLLLLTILPPIPIPLL